MKKSILLITVTFPPRLSVASIRMYNYAKILSKNGWDVHVLTANQKGEFTSNEFDLRNMQIHQIRWNDPFNWIQKIKNKELRKIVFKLQNIFIPYLSVWMPDIRFYSWRKNGFNLAEKIIEEKGINYIYSTFSPPTPHMLSKKLKKKIPQLVWIAEFRDLMSFSHGNNWMRSLFAEFHNYFEKQLMASANFVFCDTKGHSKFMSEKLNKGIHLLYNGCLFEEYKMIERSISEEFKITFTGNIYKKTNDVDLFLKSFSEWVKCRNKARISINFVGTNKSRYLRNLIEKYDLPNYVNFIEKQPHNLVRKIQKNSQILLHFCWNKEEQYGNISGKLFEYISSRTPILSIGNESEIKHVLKETSSGSCCSTTEEIIDFLEDYYLKPRENPELDDNSCFYSKKNQIRNFEAIILNS